MIAQTEEFMPLFPCLLPCSAPFECKEPACLSERQVRALRQCNFPSLARGNKLLFCVYLQPSLI